MSLPGLEILRVVPERTRPPQANIPQTLGERERLRASIVGYVDRNRDVLVPPLVVDELRRHADAVIAALGTRMGCSCTLTFDRKALRLPGFQLP